MHNSKHCRDKKRHYISGHYCNIENFPDLDNFTVKEGEKFFENLFQRIALFLCE